MSERTVTVATSAVDATGNAEDSAHRDLLHKLGVFCGLAAAVWLGSAEAPTKLVNEGFSPFLISMGMVMGAFVKALDRAHITQRHRVPIQ